jgi:hypothetical protein
MIKAAFGLSAASHPRHVSTGYERLLRDSHKNKGLTTISTHRRSWRIRLDITIQHDLLYNIGQALSTSTRCRLSPNLS